MTSLSARDGVDFARNNVNQAIVNESLGSVPQANGSIDGFVLGVQDAEPVAGYTHTYYRYPARFSPHFVRGAIEAFTDPGDVVLDPFMGGGTTLVEALLSGRRGIGTDISSLAVFVAEAKTDPPYPGELEDVVAWSLSLSALLNLRRRACRSTEWITEGYQRNINDAATWRIRKTLELALPEADRLPSERQRRFARCAILKTAQWALDCRARIPAVSKFRERLTANIFEMAQAANSLHMDVCSATSNQLCSKPLCLNRSVVGLETDSRIARLPAPRLVVTSPPYAGVHVLYHRWQVQGRRETPAPYWIAAQKDGMGASYYTFGDRKSHTKYQYYDGIKAAFTSVANLCDRRTLVVQLVAFAQPEEQLVRYLDTMEQAGFEAATIPGLVDASSDPIWRSVPGRKFYASLRDNLATHQETVLIHRLRHTNKTASHTSSPE